MGKSTISIAVFNSYVSHHYQRVSRLSHGFRCALSVDKATSFNEAHRKGALSGVGKYPIWTPPKYWRYNLQQILDSDVQNLQNGTCTKPWYRLIQFWKVNGDVSDCGFVLHES